PRCLHRDNPPTNGITAGGSLTAAYRCGACRHIWTCTWAIVPGQLVGKAWMTLAAIAVIAAIQRRRTAATA
ncbi:hypothetical protein KBZ21_40515, partial [Streptomyces sp. A73]|nr:hypothetical protein [Streptomyces sp. A73]